MNKVNTAGVSRETALKLLRAFARDLGGRITNDYTIADTPANRAFLKALNAAYRDPEDTEVQKFGSGLYVMDNQLLSFIADVLAEKEA